MDDNREFHTVGTLAVQTAVPHQACRTDPYANVWTTFLSRNAFFTNLPFQLYFRCRIHNSRLLKRTDKLVLEI